jgi:hypothetical protein
MRTLLALLALLLTGCVTIKPVTPADDFFARFSGLCDKAFEGRIVSPAAEAYPDIVGKRLVMHVRECSDNEIRIPFHVGDNRSRTWIVTRAGAGLRLKHDHRHEDGKEDAITQYGGDTASAGSGSRQEFPADAFTKALFNRQYPSISTNVVWAMEVEPSNLFAYQLRRPGRFFRVEFDLKRPVAIPPAPWGSR